MKTKFRTTIAITLMLAWATSSCVSNPQNKDAEKSAGYETISAYKAKLANLSNDLNSMSIATESLKELGSVADSETRSGLIFEYIKFRNNHKESPPLLLTTSTYEQRRKDHAEVGIDYTEGMDVYLVDKTGWLTRELRDIAPVDWISYFSLNDSRLFESSFYDKSDEDIPWYQPYENSRELHASIDYPQLHIAIANYESYLMTYPEFIARDDIIAKLEHLYSLLINGASSNLIFEIHDAQPEDLGGISLNQELNKLLKNKVQELKVSGSYLQQIKIYLWDGDPQWIGYDYVKQLYASLEKNDNRAITVWTKKPLTLR